MKQTIKRHLNKRKYTRKLRKLRKKYTRNMRKATRNLLKKSRRFMKKTYKLQRGGEKSRDEKINDLKELENRLKTLEDQKSAIIKAKDNGIEVEQLLKDDLFASLDQYQRSNFNRYIRDFPKKMENKKKQIKKLTQEIAPPAPQRPGPQPPPPPPPQRVSGGPSSSSPVDPLPAPAKPECQASVDIYDGKIQNEDLKGEIEKIVANPNCNRKM